MNSNIENKIANRTVQVNEQTGRILVSVSLSPRIGREPTVRVSAGDIRLWLQEEKKIKAGELISGSGIHNNMSRRLGTRTLDDLSTDFVFALIKEEPPAPKKAAVKKAAPKRTTKTTSAKPKVVKETKAKVVSDTQSEVKTTSTAKPKAKASTTSRRRTTAASKAKTGDKK
tara:strand:- start:415 stop:927 length:513 start_codon:yes stop_codon:yes gene_type:complete